MNYHRRLHYHILRWPKTKNIVNYNYKDPEPPLFSELTIGVLRVPPSKFRIGIISKTLLIFLITVLTVKYAY